MFWKNVLCSSFYSISFDECFNKVLQKTQLDLVVRCMKKRKSTLPIFYFSIFRADSLKKALLSEIQDLNPKSLIQISIDGPNVNIASAKKVDTDRDATGLINTGSGSLHIIHGAFKSRVEATLWKINKVLKHLCCLFDHTSARRDDYVNETGLTTFIILWHKMVRIKEGCW